MLKIKRLKCLLAVASVALTIYTISIVPLGLAYSPLPSDVAVVLGNEVEIGGKVSPRLQARLDAAINLYQQNLVNNIIVSGGNGKSGYNEAVVMAEYLKEKGVNDTAIIQDPDGFNTMATAVNTAKIIKERNFKSVVIVSQYFHLPRCVLAFKKAGATNYSATYPNYFEIRDIFSIVREAIAIPKYLLIY